MKGLNSIAIDGLSVVPQERDTLFALQSLNVRIGLWKLMWGDIKIKEVRLDGLSLNFIKKDSIANYDILFRTSAEPIAPSEQSTSTDYTRRINTTLNLLFGLLPGNGELTHLTITERKDHNFISFRIPRFVIEDYHFLSEITVQEDSLNQQWNTEGEFNPSERRLYATLHAPQLTVPYINRRFGAEVQFDSLTCSFSQEKVSGGITSLVGQSEVRGLQVYHKRLSPETINLNRGQLDYHVNVSPQAVELDSASLVRFNTLTFHPYLRAERVGEKTNQKEWHKEVNYSAKAQFLFAKKLNLALSVQSIQPQDVRINSYDIGAFYELGRFHIEGEYLYKTYADNAYDNVHAVNSFINYDLPLRKVFNKMSFLARYDMMTSQSDGKAIDEETGALVTTDYKRHRVTGGITFSLSKAFRTDLRLNFEKYFYAKNSIAKESEQDKIVLELMVRF